MSLPSLPPTMMASTRGPSVLLQRADTVHKRVPQAAAAAAGVARWPKQQPVVVVMGVTGCGKSSVAALLALQLGCRFYEGDDLHPTSNISTQQQQQPHQLL